MKQILPIPTEIKDHLHYYPATGHCVWIKAKRGMSAGSLAGSLSAVNARHIIQFNQRQYQLGRVVWFLHHGQDPGDLHVDHINGDSTDNRIHNLRLVTHQQNHQNRGHRGTSFHKRLGKWIAKIMVNGKQYHIGYYDTEEEANSDYLKVKSILHPKHSR